MFNRVKFAINKILFQTSNKESFTKNKKIYNNNNNNKIKNNFNRVGVRKFSTFKPPNEPPNLLFIIISFSVGSLFIFKNKYK
jgi:hypothetical protein